MGAMEYSVRITGGILLITLRGSFEKNGEDLFKLMIKESPLLRETGLRAIKRMAVDVTQVNSTDLSGISVLVGLRALGDQAGISQQLAVILGDNSKMRKLLDQTKLATIFQCLTSVEELN